MTRAIVIAALLGPAPALAQEAEQAFTSAEELLAEEVWDLDDGAGDDTEWDTYDPAASFTPRGLVHAGVQLRGAGLIGDDRIPDGPLFDLSGFLDFRYTERTPMRLRVAVALSAQRYAELNMSGGRVVTTSPVALRLRLYPISIDLGRYFVVRAAGEIGMQWTVRKGEDALLSPFYGVSGELAVLALDSALEIGVFGGFQITTVYSMWRGGAAESGELQGVFGGTLAYVF